MIPKIRMLDLDEHALVLTMNKTGEVEVINPGMCDALAAAVLRTIADQLIAAHPPYPCTPDAEPEQQHDRPPEPVTGHGSRLDTDRKVWTDGRGHAWDLSLKWGDAAGGVWRWTGVLDRAGTPMMRATDGDGREPLDVVRSLYGPIAPLGGAA
ncbi:phiSA1p31-related protein [Streptomyces lydicus]|uniref:phiSA1p31-related protein n=1 Tax=Streptomyces lydicus TaxID=47763 RepID=UPI001011A434|nr:phiSA1p31-related protein [Streptomyces lydicus]MCZ1009933.1 phiSA1p31-related protein [Streptomyces lydicus]